MTDAARTVPARHHVAGAGELARRIREFDWSTTPLGPMSGWPPSLTTALDVCLGSGLPTALLWCPALTMLYNDALVPLLGRKHPAVGRPVAEVYAEAWPIMGEQMRMVLETGEPVRREDTLLPVDRDGYLEEVYFTYSYSAIHDASGQAAGVLSTGVETTPQVLARRRLATLRRLGEEAAVVARSPEQACTAALAVLADNPADVPFATVHLLDGDGPARVVASYGTTQGFLDRPPPAAVGGDTVRRVATTGVGTVATGLSTRSPGGVLASAVLTPGAPVDTAVVLPLVIAGSETPAGAVTLGVSPHRRLDADYCDFLDLVAKQVGAAVSGARSYAAQRRTVEAERAARSTAEAIAARLRSLVDGLAAIVWEMDTRTGEIVFVSERAEELLGYPTQRWLGPPDFRYSILHPDDRDRVERTVADAVAAGTDFEVPPYRVRTADGRTLWFSDVVHLAAGPQDEVDRLQGVMVDVTGQERARQASALLAEIGRQDDTGPLPERLTTLLRLSVPALADLGVVAVLGADGTLQPIAAARPGRPDIEAIVLAAHSYPISPALRPAYAAGRPFLVSAPTDVELHELAAGVRDHATRRQLSIHSAIVVPLVVGGRMLGTLSMLSLERLRDHDTADLELAGKLGWRAALMIEGERLAGRERRLVKITTALAAAGSVADAAQVLVTGVQECFDATAVAAYLRDPALGLRVVHSTGFPEFLLRHYGVVRAEDDLPVGVAARTLEPVWLRSHDDWRERFPHMTEHHALSGHEALMALPMVVGGRVVGALAAAFGTGRTFDADEQQFARTVTAHAAQAFERAALADTRREIAETLQHSLLPAELPSIDRLALAARYEPGAHGSQAGGDWYEVVPLTADRVAIVVGDVVGQGAAAAAVMGQLRSALAAALLDGCGPAEALTRLDRFAKRVAGALATTVACLVLDVATGQLRWARAGHPPPLVLGGDGETRYLESATGTVLGAGGRFSEDRTTLPPGSVLLLYTDGLVERRGEVIDEGLRRLREAALAAGPVAPDRLIDEVLSRTLHPSGPPDDVAVIAVRLGPEPLLRLLPARPEELRGLRRAVAEWAQTAGLPDDLIADLQLALGEAVANSVEHAYPAGRPGVVEVELRHAAGDSVTVRVRDFGRWHSPPDRGFRGRGLDLIRLLGADVVIIPGTGGTTVRFRMSPRPWPVTAPARPAATEEPAVARIQVRDGGGGRVLVLTGDLDLTGVAEVRDELRAALADIGPVTIDLTAVSYLASAGVGLLTEALDRSPDASLRVPVTGPVRAVLDLVGLARPT